MGSKSYTTAEAADIIGVTRATLQAWIMKGLVKPTAIQVRFGKSPARLWTDSDIARLRRTQEGIKVGRPKKDKKSEG